MRPLTVETEILTLDNIFGDQLLDSRVPRSASDGKAAIQGIIKVLDIMERELGLRNMH